MRLVKGSSGDSGVKPRGEKPYPTPKRGAFLMPSIKDGGCPLLPLCVPSPKPCLPGSQLPDLRVLSTPGPGSFSVQPSLPLSIIFIVSLYLGALCFVFFCFPIVQILPCKGALGSWRCTAEVESSPSFSFGDSILFLLVGSSSLDLPM